MTPDLALDEHWMRQALALAEESVGLASPNPRVGCVLVKDGKPIGAGAHHYDAKDHAEVVALKQAGGEAQGATAYVTLEPCAHTGRTGPCALALVQARVARVVVATGDPFPQVNGRGLGILRDAGIEVATGVLRDAAQALNHGFASVVRRGLPYVTLKAGVSLDGRIAPYGAEPGQVHYLTSDPSLRAVQRMRHGSDALLTAMGTILSDNPSLTDRSGLPRRRPLLRVVLDAKLRIPHGSRLLASAQNDVLLLTTEPESSPRHRELRERGVRVQTLAPDAEGHVDLRAAFRYLAAECGVLNVLAEGGSNLTRALLTGGGHAGGYVDRLTLFYAPVLLGERGVPLLAGETSLTLHPLAQRIGTSGPDTRVDLDLRDPWRSI